MPNAPSARVDEIISTQHVLSRFGINESVERLAPFLANVAHESGELKIDVENTNYSHSRAAQIWPSRYSSAAAVRAKFGSAPGWQMGLFNETYGNRMGNGPAHTGDGYKYRGRGWPQLTGKDGYRNVGSIIGIDLVADPDKVVATGNRLLVAAGFWSWKNLNQVADRNDFSTLVRRWNGGHIGMADRKKYLARAQKVLSAIPVGPRVLREGMRGEDVRDLQRVLQAHRYSVGAVDGRFGNLTRDALLAWQADNGRMLRPEARAPEDIDIIRHSPPRPLSEERKNATAKDLAGESRIVDDATTVVKTGLGVGGAVGGAKVAQQSIDVPADPSPVATPPSGGTFDQIGGIIDQVERPVGLIQRVMWTAQDFGIDIMSFVADHAVPILGLGLAGAIFYAYRVRKARVQDHNEGATL
jgi:putative chitinase